MTFQSRGMLSPPKGWGTLFTACEGFLAWYWLIWLYLTSQITPSRWWLEIEFHLVIVGWYHLVTYLCMFTCALVSMSHNIDVLFWWDIGLNIHWLVSPGWLDNGLTIHWLVSQVRVAFVISVFGDIRIGSIISGGRFYGPACGIQQGGISPNQVISH